MDLQEIEQEALTLIHASRSAVYQLSNREALIAQKTIEVRTKLQAIACQIDQEINQCQAISPNSPALPALIDYRNRLTIQLADVTPLAAAEVDNDLIEVENKLLAGQEAKELYEWRQQLYQDFQDTLLEVDSFYAAMDAAILVRAYRPALEAINVFDRVVDLLINAIEINDRKKSIRNGMPCINRQGTSSEILQILVEKAKENRRATGGGEQVQLLIRHRLTKDPPTTRFHKLTGTVMVIGGCRILQERTAQRLRRSNIQFTWRSIPEWMKDNSILTVTAQDVVIFIQGYDLKEQEESALQRLSYIANPIELQSPGLGVLIETITKALITLQLQQSNILRRV